MICNCTKQMVTIGETKKVYLFIFILDIVFFLLHLIKLNLIVITLQYKMGSLINSPYSLEKPKAMAEYGSVKPKVEISCRIYFFDIFFLIN